MIVVLLLVFFSATLTAQATLSESDFLALVAEHHPLAVRADLQFDRARVNTLMARGEFDPKAYADFSQKHFKGKQYYDLLDAGLKVPTWFGVELNAAYERSGGVCLNPENELPDGGLFAAGLSVSLLRGLTFDVRRAELRRAEVYERATATERRILLNNLLYEAGQAYWEWIEAAGTLSVFEEGLELASVRARAVNAGARLGDRAAIDTLEAGIQVDNRRIDLDVARLELENAVELLQSFLWLDGTIPLELAEETSPPPAASLIVLPLLDTTAPAENPEISRTRLKLEELAIDRRLQREQLKPKLDLKYNALLSGDGFTPGNYKWGVNFGVPLLLRKDRGKLALLRVKTEETELELSDKTAQFTYKLAAARNSIDATARQYVLVSRNVENYRRLLAGERELFRVGESSLFLVNSREVKYLEARTKSVQLFVKHWKARLQLRYVEGF